MTNTYFEEIKRIGEAFEEDKKRRQEEKIKILEKYGWGSEEIKAWYEEDKKHSYPINPGTCKAYRAWLNAKRRGDDLIEMDDFLWDREVADFIDAFKRAGIKSFVYTNQSTALMENIHDFVKNGCKMEGLYTIKRTECNWGEEATKDILGIRFTL